MSTDDSILDGSVLDQLLAGLGAGAYVGGLLVAFVGVPVAAIALVMFGTSVVGGIRDRLEERRR